MLVTAGLSDPRVTYWEPAKWVARLRATKTDDRPLLLKTNMGAGHGGKSGRWESLRETAEAQAFVADAGDLIPARYSAGCRCPDTAAPASCGRARKTSAPRPETAATTTKAMWKSASRDAAAVEAPGDVEHRARHRDAGRDRDLLARPR